MRSVTYYLTRDTNCVGTLSPAIDCWYRKPLRHKLTFDRGYVWMPSNGPDGDFGYYGAYDVAESLQIFGTVPESDLEMLRVDQNVVEPSAPSKRAGRQ